MIFKNNLKYIKSLQLKKMRKEENRFLIEGTKSVLEILKADFNIHQILASADFIEGNRDLLQQKNVEFLECSTQELSQTGSFEHNNTAIAVAEMKPNTLLIPEPNEYLLVLDNISDPGNLGTIIRIADWYGIQKIIVSKTTAEVYNPKVIAASMGSFTRTNIYYTDLIPYLESHKIHVYGARLEGKSIYETTFQSTGGMILMGNESHGISPDLYSWVDEFVFIPRFGHAESLNVGVATAIFCDHVRRGMGER